MEKLIVILNAAGVALTIVGLVWAANYITTKRPKGAPPPSTNSGPNEIALYADLDKALQGLWIVVSGAALQFVAATLQVQMVFWN